MDRRCLLIRAGAALAAPLCMRPAQAAADEFDGDPFKSYQWADLRKEFLGPKPQVVFDARVRVRFAEITDSARIVRVLLEEMAEGPVAVSLPVGSGEGIGVAESFRGDAWHFVRLDGGLIAANFMRDPSWAHWPLLEAAIEGNIVADFPLINKSFNGSYSGVDL